MAHPTAIAAFEARLGTMWNGLPVVGPSTPKARPAGNAGFLVLDFPVTNTEIKSVGDPGNNIWRDEGICRVRIHQPKAANQTAIAQAHEISALFLGKQFGGVQCWGPSDAPIDDENDRGLYYVQAVVIPYDFDHFG